MSCSRVTGIQELPIQPSEPNPHFRPLLEQTIGRPFVEGNDVRILHNGVEIFPAMLDAKALTVDSSLAVAGSPNLNFCSMGKDEECCVVLLSSELTEQLDARFENDRRYAEEQNAAEWESRGWWCRLRERCCRLMENEL